MANEVTPESISANWPLIQEVKRKLGHVHASSLSILADTRLSLRKIDHISYAFQKDVIRLEKPGTLQDVVQTVTSVILHPLHVSLALKTLGKGNLQSLAHDPFP